MFLYIIAPNFFPLRIISRSGKKNSSVLISPRYGISTFVLKIFDGFLFLDILPKRLRVIVVLAPLVYL